MTMKYSNKDGVKEKSKRKLSASSKLKIINFSKSSEEKDSKIHLSDIFLKFVIFLPLIIVLIIMI